MSSNEDGRSDQGSDNMEQEEAKVNVEETSVNLGCIKQELDEGEYGFDENQYKITLTFDNIFGESSNELRDNKDSLIGFLDDEVIMETGCIKLEDVKDEEDLIREVMGQSDCNRCGGIYIGYCQDCSSLSHILNNITPNINPDPVLNTAPINMLEISEVSSRQAVFAFKNLPQGIILGPFEGVAPIESTTGLQWKIKDKKLLSDENGNWMKYIQSVPSHAAKNLDVFHIEGLLYFETSRDIQQGEELLVCYCEENEVSKSENEEESYLIPVKKEENPKVYACTLCCLGFRLERCLMEHKSKCPQGDNGSSTEDFEITQCRCCKVWLEKQEHLERHMLYCLENYNRSRYGFSQFQTIKTNEVAEICGNLYQPTSTKASICDLTESEIIQSKWSHGIGEKTCIKRKRKKHLATVHSNMMEKKYKCSECFYQTNCKSSFDKHSIKHSGIKRYQCDICKKKFNQKVGLKTHIENLHLNIGDKKYRCSECSFQTHYHIDLRRHSNVHSGIKAYQCDICKMKFSLKGGLTTHIKNQHFSTEEKKYKCPECSYRTNQKGHLNTHIIIHSGIKPFECDVCKMKFSQKGSLMKHVTNQHRNTMESSEYSFRKNDKSNLENHRITHSSSTEEKKYKCSECFYQTNHKGSFNTHSIKHSGIKRFQCDVCKMVFSEKGSLKRHIENLHSNTKEKKYKCSVCPLQAHYKADLSRHSVVHSGIKLYQCDICKRKFSQKGSLGTHVKNLHSNTREKKYK